MESLKSSKAVWQKPEQFEDKFLVTSLHQKFYERPIPKRDQHIHTLWEKIPDQSLLLKHLAFMLLITWLIWIWMYIDSNIWQLSTLPFISRCLFSGNHGWKKISCSMYQMSERIWRVSWTFCILWSSDQVILSRVCVLYVNGLGTKYKESKGHTFTKDRQAKLYIVTCAGRLSLISTTTKTATIIVETCMRYLPDIDRLIINCKLWW